MARLFGVEGGLGEGSGLARKREGDKDVGQGAEPGGDPDQGGTLQLPQGWN